jgi:hypothetical protein
MNALLQNPFNRKNPSSLLGLALEGDRLEGAVLRRTNGSLQVLQRFVATLSLDPLTGDAELVGREILNHLEAAGVRERACVVALPLKWALAAQTTLPPLPEADVPDFLQLEAERGFPTDVTALQVATSRLRSASGQQHATFVGIPKNHVERLERALRAARLRPISFSIGIAALQPARADDEGVLALVAGDSQVGLQISCGGGVAALRALEGAVETEAGERRIQGDRIAREVRITLGQLPEDVRAGIKCIRIFGSAEQARPLAEAVRARVEPGGLRIEPVTTYPANEFGRTLPPDTGVSPAFSLAARQLTGRDDPFEFLPPRVSTWQQLTAKYASGRWRTAGLAAAAAIVLVLGLFGVQQWQLMRLRSRWTALTPKVRELTAVQDQIQKYRPWHDDSFRYLGILKKLAAAFPEDGSVTAKTLEIRELTESRDPEAARDVSVVSCTGNAANYAAWIKTVHQVGAIQGVSNLVPLTRGKSPMQFTLEFHLKGGVREN